MQLAVTAMARFRNPQNNYEEDASGRWSWLWRFLFGFLYFAIKGNWRHAVGGVVLAIFTAGVSWFIYPFFICRINDKHYLRKG